MKEMRAIDCGWYFKRKVNFYGRLCSIAAKRGKLSLLLLYVKGVDYCAPKITTRTRQ